MHTYTHASIYNHFFFRMKLERPQPAQLFLYWIKRFDFAHVPITLRLSVCKCERELSLCRTCRYIGRPSYTYRTHAWRVIFIHILLSFTHAAASFIYHHHLLSSAYEIRLCMYLSIYLVINGKLYGNDYDDALTTHFTIIACLTHIFMYNLHIQF